MRKPVGVCVEDAYERAVQKVVLTAEVAQLKAVREEAVRRLEEARARDAALERLQAAGPALERLERLYPGRTSTRELLNDAGVTCEDVGLQESDPEFADELMREMLQ